MHDKLTHSNVTHGAWKLVEHISLKYINDLCWDIGVDNAFTSRDGISPRIGG